MNDTIIQNVCNALFDFKLSRAERQLPSGEFAQHDSESLLLIPDEVLCVYADGKRVDIMSAGIDCDLPFVCAFSLLQSEVLMARSVLELPLHSRIALELSVCQMRNREIHSAMDRWKMKSEIEGIGEKP
jgi:hypothetical protein